jgi:hypothetical protein
VSKEPPKPTYAHDTKVLKLLIHKLPLEISGPVLIDKNRKVVWKNLCMLGPHHIECIVEFSLTKTKFFILALDLFAN